MILELPYGKGKQMLEIPEKRVRAVLTGALEEYVPSADEEALIRDSIAHPIGSKPLHVLARGKKKVVVICSDHTRPVPSRLIVPMMLEEIRKGNPDAEITLLIATGCHRRTSGEELLRKFGAEIFERETILIHDCEDEANLAEIGTLPSGGRLAINRKVYEADLVVSEGFIEPHFFAGFSGGRKSILPGVASKTCVHYNHNSAFMDSPFARTGVLDGNPIHRDMVYAAEKAKLAFIVNVVLNAKKQVIASFAGHFDKAHRAGTAFVTQQMQCKAAPAPIVISSNNGYPLDQNVYQMAKATCTADATCQDGGVIIVVGECADGIGGEGYYQELKSCSSCAELLEQYRRVPPEETATDQWQVHIAAKILARHIVILVSEIEDSLIRDMKMLPAHSLQEALRMAEEVLHAPDAPVTVIPEGISVIVR